MNIYYINLDSAEARRNHLEENLAAYAGGEPCQRIPAFDADYVECNQINGAIRPGEKACILSHIKAIETSLESKSPALILEDDAILGAQTIDILKLMLPTVSHVDILFTNVAAVSAVSMLQLFKLRRSMSDGQIGVFDTRQIDFAASSAYILLNDDAKKKVLSVFKSFKSLDSPYDLVLRELINDGALESAFFFPFLTSLAPARMQSQLRLPEEELGSVVYDTFRKLMFNESARFHPDLMAELDCVPEDFYDRDATVFGGIWKLILARNFNVGLF